MNRVAATHKFVRSFVSAAPKTSTGIEHAEAAKKKEGGKPDWSLYKVSDYLNFDKYSFYQAEVTMEASRVVQPSNQRADTLPQVKK